MSDLPDLVSLRLLCAVGSGGSIGDAARQVGMSQPAASRRLALLERSLRVPLMDRTPTGSRLTPEGMVVSDWAARVLTTVQQMSDAVAAMRTHPGADLRLAASMTIAEHLVPSWLSALRAVNPNLHVDLRVANSHDVQKLVIDDQVDLGLIESSTWDPRLEATEVARDRLVVVVHPRHPWARRSAPLPLEELAAAPLIVREPGSGTRETLDRLLQPMQPAEPLLEMGSNAAVKGAVAAGAGPAVLSLLAVQDDLATHRLSEVEVAGIDLGRALYAMWPRGRRPGPASMSLLRIARRRPKEAPQAHGRVEFEPAPQGP